MRKHLNLIQLSRALVPFLVVLFHAKAFMITYFHYNFLNLPSVSKSGGVYYFFLLSGFMAYYLNHKEFGNISKIKKYFTNKFIRIFPLYWILTLCLLLVYLILPSLAIENEIDITKVISSLFLIPNGEEPILGVAWSLVHTVFFYLIFSLMFFSKINISKMILTKWTILSFLFSINVLTSSNIYMNFFFNFNNMIFISGIVCGYIVIRININKYISAVLVIIGIIGFPLSWLNVQFGFVRIDFQLSTTISSILLILGFASIDLKNDIVLPRFAKFLGDASFSIYLSHYYCMAAMVLFLHSVPLQPIPNIVMAVLLIVLSMIAGCMVYIFLERPIHRKFKQITSRKQSFTSNKEFINKL